MKIYGKPKTLIEAILRLEDKDYIMEVKEPRSKRSIEQNNLLWKIIHAIAKQTGESDENVYCGVLEKADALSDYVITATEMEQALRKSFRGVRFMTKQIVNEKECNVYKVYLGSSKMTIKEMRELIEEAFNLANEVGADIGDFYEEY